MSLFKLALLFDGFSPGGEVMIANTCFLVLLFG